MDNFRCDSKPMGYTVTLAWKKSSLPCISSGSGDRACAIGKWGPAKLKSTLRANKTDCCSSASSNVINAARLGWNAVDQVSVMNSWSCPDSIF